MWSFTCQEKKTDRSDPFISKRFYSASKDCPKECCKYDKCDRYEIWGSLCSLYSNSVERQIHDNPAMTLCSRISKHLFLFRMNLFIMSTASFLCHKILYHIN